jgi:hypothetical protein
VAILFFVACSGYNEEEEGGVMDLQDWGERSTISTYARRFAIWDDINNKGGIHGVHEDSRDNYSRIVLVLSPEERKDFPEDVLVLWPSEFTHITVDRLNYEIIRAEIDLSLFSLEYPITIENIVYDWGKIFQLWVTPTREGGIGERRFWVD